MRTTGQKATLQAKDRLPTAAVAKTQHVRQGTLEKVRATRPFVEQKTRQALSTLEQRLRGSGTRTVESLRQNPKAFALIGVGLGE